MIDFIYYNREEILSITAKNVDIYIYIYIYIYENFAYNIFHPKCAFIR